MKYSAYAEYEIKFALNPPQRISCYAVTFHTAQRVFHLPEGQISLKKLSLSAELFLAGLAGFGG